LNPLIIAIISSEPWFTHWNHGLLEILFHYIRHGGMPDHISDFLVLNPIVSTWIFAAAFYTFWMRDDEQKGWRRRCLFRAVVAFGIATLITFVLRPWISWPAPSRNPDFQSLYPQYLWGQGSVDCFPSHSTLAYFVVAVGFWPLNRWLSSCLSLLVLLVISLPRVYIGGHYPVDLLASVILALLVLAVAWQLNIPPAVTDWLVARGRGSAIRDLLLFFWTLELAEGFHISELLLGAARRLSQRT
jgi:membrane-associated phospholipid phosphatase